MTEIQAYNANPTATTAKCGPIADWDVSAITNMSYLFYNMQNFNADVSNWDTSSVTNMQGMFWVRSKPVLSPICSRASTARWTPSPPSASPNPAPHRMPSFRLSAARVGIQPAAELRHLQRHRHAIHVCGASVARICLCTLSPICTVEASPVLCLHHGRLPPSRLSGRTSPSIVCPPFDPRQGASAFNQPLSFDTSKVTNMHNMFYVRASPCPAPNLQSSPPLHAACPAIAHHLPPPSPHVVPHRMPSFRLSAVRVGVQPAAEL
eukprot:scaffold36265_cov43-Phaeocystis_antarctica.AAC.1